MISRRLIVSIAVIMADAACVYVTLAMTSVVLGQENAPLSWPLIIVLLSLGALTRALGDSPKALVITLGAGAAAAYAGAASHPIFGHFELGWLLQIAKGNYPILDVLGVMIALLGGAWSWRRGMTLSTEVFLEARTGQVFRSGLVIMSLAMLLELITARELGSASLLLPFFLASLAAMALARMPDVTRASRNWVVVIATTVVVAIGLGLLIGVIFGAAGRGGVSLVSSGWDQIAGFVVAIVAVVVITIVTVIISMTSWFGTADNRNEEVKPIFELPNWLLETQPEGMGGEHGPPEYWPYFAGALIVYLLFRVLKPALKNRFLRPPADDALREALEVETQPINELARLLKILLGVGGSTRARVQWRYPRENPGITEVFELYFEMLDATMARGGELAQSATPLEQMEGICDTLPEVPVARITQCFNAACYGQHATSREELKELQAVMREALASSSLEGPR